MFTCNQQVLNEAWSLVGPLMGAKACLAEYILFYVRLLLELLVIYTLDL